MTEAGEFNGADRRGLEKPIVALERRRLRPGSNFIHSWAKALARRGARLIQPNCCFDQPALGRDDEAIDALVRDRT